MAKLGEAYEVIVVGGGGAGLTAALTAARLGRSVLLIEKNTKPGGTTRLSVGSISVSCTPHQRRQGISDHPDLHFEDMGKFAGRNAPRDNLGLRQLYVRNAPEAFRFLTDLGVEFMGPVPEPPHRHPRLHNVVPHSGSLVRCLLRACRKEGVTIATRTELAHLRLQDGRVTGVVLKDGRQVRAERAVILACGDFSGSAAMKQAHLSTKICNIPGINPASTGDGQRAGVEAGSELINGDLAWGPELRFVPPPRPSLIARIPPVRAFAKLTNWAILNLPQRLLRPVLMSFVTTFLAPSQGLFREGALLINSEGRRFCDGTDGPEVAVSRQPGGEAWILLDGSMAEKFAAWPHFVSTAPGVAYAYLPDYRRNRRDICNVAETLRDVARKAGIPAQELVETVAAYNAASNRSGPRIDGKPFYLIGPLKSWICFTDGGVRVNEELAVETPRGEPITGLYAAGSAGQGGLLLEGHGHHLGWAITSGRLAGQSAAFALPVRGCEKRGDQPAAYRREQISELRKEG
ncbi:FAD-dependent oxidoreductase [uncultured Roseovarius sp.]|uniref:FAD-dependent oxidoreductase n=1 Tax=uncultured Roseovarius sp. TaxID=293344 RepID=UPI00262CD09C|nr:FAD-dependent oxidoreductase [uncultured Roseovarius sp.]